MPFFELRQYQINPGHMGNWVKFMDEVVIPFQVSCGMVIVGSFYGEEDQNLYVWIRRFESEEERQRLYDAVYGSDHWKNEIKPTLDTMLNREPGLDVRRIIASPRSMLR